MASLCNYAFLVLGFIVLSTGNVVQDFYWRDYTPGNIPYDAIEGAPGRYIGQANYKGNVVATIFPHSKTAVIEMGGQQNIKGNVKILCSSQPERFYWEYVDFTKPHELQMKDAVKGGYQEGLTDDIFIGKALHESEWKIGKVVEIGHTYQGLWIWNRDRGSVNLKAFHLLKYNTTTVGSGGEIIFQRM